MIIVKLSNGNVVLKDASGNVLKRLENHSYLQVVSSNAIEVYNNADKITTIYVSEITGTQIEPAGVIPFAGDVYDLMDILTNSFFFISGGGGSSNAIDINYNNSTSGLTATNVQDAIDELSEIIFTIEFIDGLNTDFYAPYDMKINSISNVLNAPTITILDDGVTYTLTNTIFAGSKISVSSNINSVINLNVIKA